MALDFARFHEERCGIQDIVKSWLGRAEHTHDNFDKFYFLWSAFNAWALIVTLGKQDKVMVDAIADDHYVKNFYRKTVGQDAALLKALRGAKSSFPLQSFADLVHIDYMYDWRGNQGTHEYHKKIADSGKKVKVSPGLIVEDSASVIRCMYMVRCNLVHGSKLATDQERAFVDLFSTVLNRMLLGNPNLLSLGKQH